MGEKGFLLSISDRGRLLYDEAGECGRNDRRIPGLGYRRGNLRNDCDATQMLIYKGKSIQRLLATTDELAIECLRHFDADQG